MKHKSAVTKEERDALLEEIIMEKTRPCSDCRNKIHHGARATVIRNHKHKIKAYACSDKCAQNITQGGRI